MPECKIASLVSHFLPPYGLQSASLLCPCGLSRQEYWSGLPFASPRYLPHPGIEAMSSVTPALQVDSFTTESPGPQQGSYLVLILILVCQCMWVREEDGIFTHIFRHCCIRITFSQTNIYILKVAFNVDQQIYFFLFICQKYIFQIVNNFHLDNIQICHLCYILCGSTVSTGRYQLQDYSDHN